MLNTDGELIVIRLLERALSLLPIKWKQCGLMFLWSFCYRTNLRDKDVVWNDSVTEAATNLNHRFYSFIPHKFVEMVEDIDLERRLRRLNKEQSRWKLLNH